MGGGSESAYQQGLQLLQSGETADAETSFRSAAELGHADAALQLGVILDERGDWGGARQWYLKAVEHGHGSPTAGQAQLLANLAAMRLQFSAAVQPDDGAPPEEDREPPPHQPAPDPAAGIPDDPTLLFAAITEQHLRTQSAFLALQSPPSDTATQRELHRQYREAAATLLELERRHNQSGLAPSPWDLQSLAQPLSQQAMMEADLIDALGEPDEAKELREWALGVAETYLDAAALDRVHRSGAMLFALEGRFNEALTALADIRRTFTERGDVVQAAQTALDEAVILDWLGDDQRSLRSTEGARELVEPRLRDRPAPSEASVLDALGTEVQSILGGSGTTGESDEEAALLRISVELVEHEARVRKAVGELDEAARLFETVLSDYASLGAASAIEYQLAAIEAARGDYAAAQARLVRIEPDFREGSFLRMRLNGLRSLQAEVALGLDEPQQALVFADEGIADLALYPDDDISWKLRWRRGRALAALGQADAALAAYDDAAAIVDSLRKAPLGYRLDSTALRSKLPLFDSAIDLAAEQRDGPAAARFVELVKARALSSVLSVPPPDRSERSELEQEFDAVTQRLDALEFQGYRGTPASVELHDQRTSLLSRRLELIEQLRLRDPRWRGLSESLPFEPEQVAETLAERGQAALTLFVRDGYVVSVLLADGDIEVATQELAAETTELLEEYTANLLRLQPDPYLLDLDEAGVGADAFVPSPLLERALAADSLLIAPHRSLHLLSWPALTFAGRRLFEHTAVGLVPNLTCISILDGDFSTEPRAALAGTAHYEGLSEIGDLPATALELDDLRALYKGRLVARSLLGPRASEKAVRALVARADAEGAILHISCHGTLSVEDPLGAGCCSSTASSTPPSWRARHSTTTRSCSARAAPAGGLRRQRASSSPATISSACRAPCSKPARARSSSASRRRSTT